MDARPGEAADRAHDPLPSSASGLRAKLMLIGAALLLSIWVLAFASHGFFSGDSGVKYAEASALLSSGFTSRAIPYDTELDPTGRFRPYREHLVRIEGGRGWVGPYSWLLAAVSAPGIAAFGVHGAILLPLLGGLLTLFATFWTLRELGVRDWLAALAASACVLLTPILFYASQYAGHTLATGFTIVALGFTVRIGHGRRRDAVLAGVFVGLAGSLRAEGYCAVAAIGLIVAASPATSLPVRARHCALFLAGCLPILAVYWGVNLLTVGSWDVLSHTLRDRVASLASASILLTGKIEGAHAGRWLLAAAAIPLAGLIIGRLRPSVLRGCLLLATAAGLAWLAILGVSLSSGRTVGGLLVLTPLVGLGFITGPWRTKARAVWLFAVLFVLQVLVFDRSGTAGGLQLGTRMLMPAIPPLIVLAMLPVEEALRSSRSSGPRLLALAPTLLLATLSGALLFSSLEKPTEIANASSLATARVRAIESNVVVTQRWWESEIIAALVEEGWAIYTVGDDPVPLLSRLAASGVERIAYVGVHPLRLDLEGGYRAQTTSLERGSFTVQTVELR